LRRRFLRLWVAIFLRFRFFPEPMLGPSSSRNAGLRRIGRSGRVFGEDVHPIQLGPDSGRGYTLCDDCGVLANLPTDLTLN